MDFELGMRPCSIYKAGQLYEVKEDKEKSCFSIGLCSYMCPFNTGWRSKNSDSYSNQASSISIYASQLDTKLADEVRIWVNEEANADKMGPHSAIA